MAHCHPEAIKRAAAKKAGLICDAVLIYEMLILVPKLIKMSYAWWDPILLMWYPNCAKFILTIQMKIFPVSISTRTRNCLSNGGRTHMKSRRFSLPHHPKRSKISHQGSRGCFKRTRVSHRSCVTFVDPNTLSQITTAFWEVLFAYLFLCSRFVPRLLITHGLRVAFQSRLNQLGEQPLFFFLQARSSWKLNSSSDNST